MKSTSSIYKEEFFDFMDFVMKSNRGKPAHFFADQISQVSNNLFLKLRKLPKNDRQKILVELIEDLVSSLFSKEKSEPFSFNKYFLAFFQEETIAAEILEFADVLKFSLESFVDEYLLSNNVDRDKLIESIDVFTSEVRVLLLRHSYDYIKSKVTDEKNILSDIIRCHYSGIVAFDYDFNVLVWNFRMKQISGIGEETAKGEDIDRLFNILELQPPLNIKGQIEERIFLSTHKIKIGNDDKVFQVGIYPLENSINSIGGYCLFEDVSHSVAVEKDLKDKDFFLQEVFDSSPDYIYLFDQLENKVVFANDRSLDILGRTPEEIVALGPELMNDIHPDDMAIIFRHREALKNIDNATISEIQFRQKNKDGKYVWLNSRGKVFKRDKEGKVVMFLHIATDISAKIEAENALLSKTDELGKTVSKLEAAHKHVKKVNKQLEETIWQRTVELSRSEEQYRFLTNSIPIILWTAKGDGVIDFFNSWWYQFTGLSYKENQGLNWGEIVHPEEFASISQLWEQAVKSGGVFELEFRIRSRQGNYRWHINKAVPLKDGTGETIKWFGSSIDIHDQKEGYEKLLKSNKELLRINNDLDNFVYTASHDIRTPVANVEGLVYFLEDCVKENNCYSEEISTGFSMIKDSIYLFKNRIYSLSEIAKIQRNKPNDVEELELNGILDHVLDSLFLELKESQAQISSNFSLCPSIIFSRHDLNLLFYQTLSNAIRFRHPERLPVIKIESGRIGPKEVMIKVADNGIGIEEKDFSKLFQMFKKLKPSGKGEGLGLYMVKRVLENNDGTVEVQSVPGSGSVFYLKFKENY